MDVRNVDVGFWMQNEKECGEMLKNSWDKVPLLNCNDLQYFPNNRLVRFRGMVQDMGNPEYYYEECEVIDGTTLKTSVKYGKFANDITLKAEENINHHSPKNIIEQRNPYVLITMPGLNTWAQEIEFDKNKIEILQSLPTTSTQPKRGLEEETDMEVETLTDHPTSKKLCTNQEPPETKTTISEEDVQCFPLPGRKGKSIPITVYNDTDKIKLNDLIECVGFLAVDPHTYSIHCVDFKEITTHGTLYGDEEKVSVDVATSLKKELLTVLTQLLFGDELAAEYLIYHLISSVYLRQGDLPVGKFSLNVCNLPAIDIPDCVEQIYKFIELLVPKSHYLPMTLQNMNGLTFVPRSDYNKNKTVSGILQLSAGTHLVLDETKLSEGKLDVQGVRAIKAISHLIKNQKMFFNCENYEMEFESDIPCLVFSEGKSLLPTDCQIKIKPHVEILTTFDEVVEASKVFLNPELLQKIRNYLSYARIAQYDLSDSVQEMIETDFVKMRRTLNVTADDLHNLLVLSRLICLSEGKAVLNEACWKRACQLEQDRKARL